MIDSGHSFIAVWHYEGRDIPIEVIGLAADVKARLVEAIVDFLWEHREPAAGGYGLEDSAKP